MNEDSGKRRRRLHGRVKPKQVQGKVVLGILAVSGASIPVLVNAAVTNQLIEDGRWPPNDLSATMEDNYNYGVITMQGFLAAVRRTLDDGLPSLNFQFDHAFVLSALPMAVAELMGAIEGRTS
jgi:hypothetical protein